MLAVVELFFWHIRRQRISRLDLNTFLWKNYINSYKREILSPRATVYRRMAVHHTATRLEENWFGNKLYLGRLVLRSWRRPESIFYKGSGFNHQGVYASKKLILLSWALKIYMRLRVRKKATPYHMIGRICQKSHSKRFRNRGRIHSF